MVGHTHRELRDSLIGRTHFTQPNFWAQSLSVTHVLLERTGSGRWKVVSVNPQIIPLADVPVNQRIQNILAGPGDDARRWLGTPIGRATAAMPARYGRAGADAAHQLHAVGPAAEDRRAALGDIGVPARERDPRG